MGAALFTGRVKALAIDEDHQMILKWPDNIQWIGGPEPELDPVSENMIGLTYIPETDTFIGRPLGSSGTPCRGTLP
jgi:hypothetical protein